MAFFIEYGFENSIEKMEFHVPISNEHCKLLHTAARGNRVISFSADGDELEHLKARFNNLPIRKGGFCTWRGEMAQFICENFTG